MTTPRDTPPSIAVIGAGVAGSRTAQALHAAGHTVRVFDKSRGPGGRLATRRLAWDGLTLAFDHGAAGFEAADAAFEAGFVAPARAAGRVQRWDPVTPAGPAAPRWRARSPQPDACRWMLDGLALSASHTVNALVRDGGRWRLTTAEHGLHQGVFDAVVLALPPAQAAPLVAPHRADWAAAAAAVAMAPCWTLMLLSDAPAAAGSAAWDLLEPADGPIARLTRQEARLEAAAGAGLALWVVHATAAWSAAHLEDPPESVQQALLEAWRRAWSAAEAGRAPPPTRHALVHRWRYAQRADAPALPGGPALPAPAAWDAALGLGLAGDWLGSAPASPGGAPGVEVAWLSGDALARHIGGGRG